MDNIIIDVNGIDTDLKEGRLLLAAIAKITTESQTDKTPDEVLKQISELANGMQLIPLNEIEKKIKLNYKS